MPKFYIFKYQKISFKTFIANTIRLKKGLGNNMSMSVKSSVSFGTLRFSIQPGENEKGQAWKQLKTELWATYSGLNVSAHPSFKNITVDARSQKDEDAIKGRIEGIGIEVTQTPCSTKANRRQKQDPDREALDVLA